MSETVQHSTAAHANMIKIGSIGERKRGLPHVAAMSST